MRQSERDSERERWGGEGREGMSLNKRHVVGRQRMRGEI